MNVETREERSLKRNDDWNLECEIAAAMRENGSFGARNGSNELECTDCPHLMTSVLFNNHSELQSTLRPTFFFQSKTK